MSERRWWILALVLMLVAITLLVLNLIATDKLGKRMDEIARLSQSMDNLSEAINGLNVQMDNRQEVHVTSPFAESVKQDFVERQRKTAAGVPQELEADGL